MLRFPTSALPAFADILQSVLPPPSPSAAQNRDMTEITRRSAQGLPIPETFRAMADEVIR
jgi:hypothetical protein